MAELVFGPAVDARSPDAVRGWLERNGVQSSDADAILETDLERLFFYRKLVRQNLRGALELAIGRSMSRLGPVFDEYFDRFLAERGARTHYLRDVTDELLDFCQDSWASDPRVPPYVWDLARHEAVQIEIGAMDCRRTQVEAGELELEAPVRFIEAVRLMRYEHAVHRLSEDPEDRSLPEPKPTEILVYRSPDHEVRYLELTPLAAEILGRLLSGLPLGASVRDACAEMGVSLDTTVLDGTARLLADLAERGALTGGATDG